MDLQLEFHFRSTGVTPLSRTYGPLRFPARPFRRFCISVVRGSLSLAAVPGLPGSSTDLSTRGVPNHPGRFAGCFCLLLTNDLVRLPPSRRTGPLGFPIEAESGSLALRLACSPPDSPVPLPRLALVRLHAEQAIYMVNSFQFKRSARLILAYRPKGAEGRKHVTVRNCNKRPQTGESKLKRG
jgi:hypothetical protein